MEAELPTQPSHADEMQLDSRTRRTVIQPRAGLTSEEIAAEQVATQPVNSGFIPNVQVDTESTARNHEAEEPDQPYTMPIPEATPAATATTKQPAREPVLYIVIVAALVLVAAAAFYFIAL